MIKQALAQVDIPYLNKLFDTFIILKDEREQIKVGIKIIQKADKLNNKDRLIFIMDRIYEIVNKQRKMLREFTNQEVVEAKHENKKKIKYLRELKDHSGKLLADLIKKIIKELKKGLASVINHSREMELFLSLNIADYYRYLCEVITSQHSKDEYIKETENAYVRFFTLAEESNLNVMNPSNVCAHYNYSLFLYEILNKKDLALDSLKEKYQTLVDYLDLAYRVYIDSYPLLELMFDTIQNWVLLRELAKEAGTYDMGKEQVNKILSKATLMMRPSKKYETDEILIQKADSEIEDDEQREEVPQKSQDKDEDKDEDID